MQKTRSMIRNEKINRCIERLKDRLGNDPTLNTLEKYIEAMERENCGLRQTNCNLNSKLETHYGVLSKKGR